MTLVKPKRKIILLAILAIGIFFRLFQLGKHSLWKDELFSAVEAQKSLGELLTTNSYDHYGFAPVHYVFTHIALLFGSSDFTIRIPTVIFGLLSIVLVYHLIKSIYGKNTGLVSSFLLAISTLHIQYSREVRYYSYLVFFSGLTMIASYKIVVEKKKGLWILLFFFSTIFNLATQLTAVLVLLSETIFFVIMLTLSQIKNRDSILKKLTSGRISFAKKLAFSLVVLAAIIICVKLINSFSGFLQTATFKPAMPFLEAVKYVTSSLSGSNGLAFFLTALFLIGITLGFSKNKDGSTLLLIIFLLPTLVTYLFRTPTNPGFLIRYIIFILVPFLGFAALGLTTIWKYKPIFISLLILITPLSYTPIKNYYSMTRGDWRGVANFIKANGERGDIVIPDGDYNIILLDYYLKSKEKGFVIKKPIEPLSPEVIPFRVFYFQHDYQRPDGTINLGELFITDYEKAISFKADISPMHLVMSPLIFFWREAEEPDSNTGGWVTLDFYGQKMIRIDTADLEKAIISYRIEVPQDGIYSLYANLRLDNLPGALKYRLDDEKWSDGFQPKWERIGARTKEVKLGTFYLSASEHQLSFKNQEVGSSGHDQAIDYFYLTKP